MIDFTDLYRAIFGGTAPRPHRPLAVLLGGPLDGGYPPVSVRDDRVPNELRDDRGAYVLRETVRHDDGTLCGGIYRWCEDEPGRECRCGNGPRVRPDCPRHGRGWSK